MVEFFFTFCIDHIFISLVWLFLFCAVVYISILSCFFNLPEISCHAAIRLINQQELVVVDIRNQEDFYQGHIIYSVHSFASDIRMSGARELFRLQKKNLLIVCKDGISSCSIGRYLYKLGFKKIYILKGGIISWRSENLPLVKKRK